MLKWMLVVVLLLLWLPTVGADNLFDEIGDILTPLVPDEVSGAFAIELRPEVSQCDGHILLMGNYDLVHVIGKPFYLDIWRPSPLGAGFSYKLFGTAKRFGVGYDKKLDCYMLYFRQAVELDL